MSKRKNKKFKIKNSPKLILKYSNNALYIQIIDNFTSKILFSYSTLYFLNKLKQRKYLTCTSSFLIGKQIGKLCIQYQIKKIIFDRSNYLYHGKIKALANGLRSGGLIF
uniref:Ribosomal protein L18 n=1 Tax=Nitzschia sp. (in: diatoms) TaxID=1884248 RepID=A0A5J6DUZ1_9STRA|nr:ribosomal protein L18 [Nitzschia sp. (in: diatoms)]